MPLKPKLKLITSFDDYHEENPKLAEVLKRHNIPAIWFIECGGKYKMQQIYEFNDMGFEIGSHTIEHTILRPCLRERQKYEIEESKKAIEKVINQPVRWFAYPRGRFGEDTVELVKEAGYLYARTTRLVEDIVRSNSDNYRLATSCHCFARSEYRGMDWVDVFKERLKTGEVHLWGHMKEIVKQNDLPRLDKLFKWVNENYEVIHS